MSIHLRFARIIAICAAVPLAASASLALPRHLSAQAVERASLDSAQFFRALASQLLHDALPGRVAIHGVLSPRNAARAIGRARPAGLPAPQGRSIIRLVAGTAPSRFVVLDSSLEAVPDSAAARIESAYGTVYRIVSVTIRGDSGAVEVMRHDSHDPRPSTSSLAKVELRLARTGHAWRVVSDQLLYHSFGFYDFAPLENLPPVQRAEAELLRARTRKP